MLAPALAGSEREEPVATNREEKNRIHFPQYLQAMIAQLA